MLKCFTLDSHSNTDSSCRLLPGYFVIFIVLNVCDVTVFCLFVLGLFFGVGVIDIIMPLINV